MNDARQILRWALPGWSFFLLVGMFQASFVMLLTLGAEIGPVALPDPRLSWQFETILQGTLVSLAAGIPLGFVLWQLDALQASSGLPLTTTAPDFGWRLIRHIPAEIRDPWARTLWRLLHPDQTERWRAPEGPTVLVGVQLPLVYNWLWGGLGLVWVWGRRHYRVRSLFHAELAEAAWLHLGAEADPGRARALDLADREKTIGGIRVATMAAIGVTLVINAVLWASLPTATLVLAIAVVVPSSLVLLPFLVRRSAGRTWLAVLVISAILFAWISLQSGGVLATLAATAAATCTVLTPIAWLARLRLRRGWEWVGPFATHWVPIVLLAGAVVASAVAGPVDRLILGATAPLGLLAFAFCRVLNVNQRIVRQRRLALEVTIFRRTDWTDSRHRDLFRADEVDQAPPG